MLIKALESLLITLCEIHPDRLWCRLSACFLKRPSSLWKTHWYTVISTYSPFRCLLYPHFQTATKSCGRPFKTLWWNNSSSYYSYTTCCKHTILWSLTNLKLYLLTVVSPHILLGLEKEGLCENNLLNLCCLYVLSYRYQRALYQLCFAPHRVLEEHGAVFLEHRSGLRLWLKFLIENAGIF